MLLSVLHGFMILYYWTWFIWPFVFVFSFVYSIVSWVRNDKASTKPLWLASVALLVILSGITGPHF